jgi:hypothetical protein
LKQLNKDEESYHKQLAKTALFFNNNYWLNFQLSKQKNTETSGTFLHNKEEAIHNNDHHLKEHWEYPLQAAHEKITDITNIEEKEPLAKNDTVILSIETKDDMVPDRIETSQSTIPGEAAIESENISLVTGESTIENFLKEEFLPEGSGTETPIIQPEVTVTENPSIVITTFPSAIRPDEVNETEPISTDEDLVTHPDINPEEMPTKEAHAEHANSDVTIEQVSSKPDETTFNSAEQELVSINETAIDSSEQEELTIPAITPEENSIATPLMEKAEILPDDEKLLFVPLHTSDYFASQGIKITEEIKPTDKLGNQLKSFTEWLKTMKKIHTDDTSCTTVPEESNIQLLAEKSNTSQKIYTEAMANIFLQQGRPDKAIEVFEKLSLLNPAKSAFFAAQIENLKTH